MKNSCLTPISVCLLFFVLSVLYPVALHAGKTPPKAFFYEQLYDSAKRLLPDKASKAEKIALYLHKVSLQIGDDSLVARSNSLLGTINYYLSRYYISADFYGQALKSIHARKNDLFAEYCWSNQGVNFEILNLVPEALAAYQSSLRFAEKRGDSVNMGLNWINIGLLDAKVHHFDEAAAITFQALELFTRKQDILNMALCNRNLSTIYTDLQQLSRADSFCRASLALYQSIHHQAGAVQMLVNMGIIAAKRQQLDVSEQLLQRAVSLTSRLKMGTLLGISLSQLGENAASAGKYPQAEEYYQHAFQEFEQSGAVDKYESLYLLMADLYARTGNYKSYGNTMEQYKTYMEKHNSQKKLARYDELKALYDFEKNSRQLLQQGREIRQKQTQVFQLSVFSAIILMALGVITWFYLRTRKLMRSLYNTNVAQLNTSHHIAEESSDLKEEKKPHAELYNRIVALMEDKKLFTQFNLSLTDLSLKLGTNEKYISQAINSYSKTNFNVFVNSYRVDEAKRLMVEKGSSLSIKQISGSSGFSNVTTFYRQFKEITGLTPSTFLQMSEEQMDAV